MLRWPERPVAGPEPPWFRYGYVTRTGSGHILASGNPGSFAVCVPAGLRPVIDASRLPGRWAPVPGGYLAGCRGVHPGQGVTVG
jgi:hypothetical protein